MIKNLLFLIVVNTTILSMYQFCQDGVSLIRNNISWKNASFMVLGELIKLVSKNNFRELLNEVKKKEARMCPLDKTILDVVKKEVKGSRLCTKGKTINEETFLQEYKKNNGSKEHSPIAYELKKKLGLNRFALNQYESEAGWHPGFLLNSIIYSLMYAPYYYFVIKMLIYSKKYTIDPIFVIIVAEPLAILTKMSLKDISEKDDSQWWENCDQKYISLIYCLLIGTAMMHKFKK